MNELKATPLEDILDRRFGAKGTPRRDALEASAREAAEAFKLGEAIKAKRQDLNMTQAELGEKLGVKKSQVSRLERGRNISVSTMARVFKALGACSGVLDMGTAGKVSLW